jgi:D-alanine-D-alanine ligase-like ATP-grasp enzyme
VIDTVLFVFSQQPIIDRGWDPLDAKLELSRLGFHLEDLFVTEITELLGYFASAKQNILVWPVCYTIGEKVDGPLLVEALHQLSVPFMGASSDSLALNSKIALKKRLEGSGFQSPEYKIINSDGADAVGFPFPYLMKCEYSCDSKGVSIVRNEEEHSNSYNSLTASFDQRVFAERWERNREFTVAYIPNNVRPIIAPLEMIITSGDLFVDSNVKAHNEYFQARIHGIG